MYFIQDHKKEKLQCKTLVLQTLELLKNKVQHASVSITKHSSINVNTRNFKLETLEFNNDNIISITGYHNFKKSVVYSKDLSINNIKKMINFLLKILKYTSSDTCLELPSIHLLYFKKVYINLFYPWNINTFDIIKLAKRIELYALQYRPNCIITENININSSVNYYTIGNSYGMFGAYQTTLHKMSSCVIAQNSNHNMERDFSYTIARDVSELYHPEFIGQNSAKRALSRLFAKQLHTRKCSVIISANITNEFFSHFISAISGKNVYQQSTVLLNSLNKKIFPAWLNIVENPYIHKGLLSKPFDNEGIKTKARFIVKDGILCTWLLDNYFSKKLNLSSTGHAGGIHNWFILSNISIAFKNLLKKMDTGLLVTEFMGQGVDILTGNYSRGVFGFWVDHGMIQYPVNEVTISGNLKYMWKNIVDISKDIEYRTGIYCGSILLDSMTVSGI